MSAADFISSAGARALLSFTLSGAAPPADEARPTLQSLLHTPPSAGAARAATERAALGALAVEVARLRRGVASPSPLQPPAPENLHGEVEREPLATTKSLEADLARVRHARAVLSAHVPAVGDAHTAKRAARASELYGRLTGTLAAATAPLE